MNIDDFVKLMLTLSFSFAIIGISYALIRIVLKASDIVEELKKPVQNIGELSDLTLEDYKSIRGIIRTVANLADGINGFLEGPLKIVNKFKKAQNKNEDSQL